MRDIEETKRKILKAVGELFVEQGMKGLNIANIARRAGIDRTNVYRIFGKDVKVIIEAYIVQKDYWLKFFEKINKEVTEKNHQNAIDLIIDVLQNQWRYFSSDRQMQQLILWELSGDSNLMRSIHNTRELMSEPILELADKHFIETAVKFRPIAVLLLGGIYYANIHSISNGNMMCGIDVKSVEGQVDLMKAIQQIIEWTFEHAKKAS